MIVIPAVDIKGGRCVRLAQGRADEETVYSDDPVGAARRWATSGAVRIHVVDLDGAFEGLPRNIAATERIIASVKCEVEVGGGLRTREAVERLLAAGAARVILGTMAVEDPAGFRRIAAEHPGRINLGVDASGGRVAVRGWTATSSLDAAGLIKGFADLPLGEVIYTDISRDGMLAGPNVEELRRVVECSPFPVTASGGVATVEHVRSAVRAGAWGVIIGKALYDGRLGLEEAIAAGAGARGAGGATKKRRRT